MGIFILSDTNTIANHFIAELRDAEMQQDSMRFRRNVERLGEIFAYEISKTLNYTETDFETPLGTATIPVFNNHPVLATILRAGLPLHQGLLNYFDRSDSAFISAYRKHNKKAATSSFSFLPSLHQPQTHTQNQQLFLKTFSTEPTALRSDQIHLHTYTHTKMPSQTQTASLASPIPRRHSPILSSQDTTLFFTSKHVSKAQNPFAYTFDGRFNDKDDYHPPAPPPPSPVGFGSEWRVGGKK